MPLSRRARAAAQANLNPGCDLEYARRRRAGSASCRNKVACLAPNDGLPRRAVGSSTWDLAVTPALSYSRLSIMPRRPSLQQLCTAPPALGLEDTRLIRLDSVLPPARPTSAASSCPPQRQPEASVDIRPSQQPLPAKRDRYVFEYLALCSGPEDASFYQQHPATVCMSGPPRLFLPTHLTRDRLGAHPPTPPAAISPHHHPSSPSNYSHRLKPGAYHPYTTPGDKCSNEPASPCRIRLSHSLTGPHA